MSESTEGADELPLMRVSSGVALLGERVVVRGRDLHTECMSLSYVGYVLFNVTGRVFSHAATRVLEQFWISSGYPDARIWCNRVAAYLGSMRVDPALSTSAALAVSNSRDYGFGAMTRAYAVQAEMPQAIDEREAWLDAVLGDRRILAGYGRPLHGRDERIVVSLKTLRDQGFRAGDALKRAFWLERRLRERKEIAINVSGVWAAVAIDFGLTASEYDQFWLPVFIPGFMSVYADQRARPAGSFLPGYQTAASAGALGSKQRM